MLLMPAFGATAKGLRLHVGKMVGDIADDAHCLIPTGKAFSQLMLFMPAFFGATAKGLRLHEGQLVGDIQLMLMMHTFLFVLPSNALDAGLFWGHRQRASHGDGGDIQLMLMMRTFFFLAGRRSPS